MKFLDPLSSLQYMGGSLPVHAILAWNLSYDLDPAHMDVMCANSDLKHKY